MRKRLAHSFDEMGNQQESIDTIYRFFNDYPKRGILIRFYSGILELVGVGVV